MAKLEDGEYGVIQSENIQMYEYLMRELKNSASVLEKLPRPQVDDLCVVNSGDSLYRAKITEINPVTVFLLDLGYEDTIGKNSLRSMPKHLREIEELSFRIVFNDDTLVFEEYDQMFIQIMAKVDENFFLVQKCKNEIPSNISCVEQLGTESINCIVKSSSVTSYSRESQSNVDNSVRISDEPTPGADTRSKPVHVENTQDFQTFNDEFMSSYPQMPAIKNVIKELCSNLVGAFVVHKQYSKNLFSGLILLKRNVYNESINQLTNNMLKELNQLNHDDSFKPVTGDLIATMPKNDQNWTRGFVLSEPTNLNPDYKVVLIDNGYVCYVNSIAPLPPQFEQIPSLALTCEITSFPQNKSALKMKVSQLYKYEISSVNTLRSIAKGVLWKHGKQKSADICWQVQFNPWKPSIDEIGIQSVLFKTNDRVKITSYNTSKKCYIMSADDDNNDKRMGILDSIMKFCVNAPPLNREPLSDEIVGVFHEETFWRGQVLHREDELFLVLIIDNGNEVSVFPDDMRALPEKFKMPYCTAVPVTLANLRSTEINRKARNYMTNIIAKGKEFKLVIEDQCKVVLQFISDQDYNKENDGRTSLNEYLNFLLTPEWKLPRVDHLQFEVGEAQVNDSEFVKYESNFGIRFIYRCHSRQVDTIANKLFLGLNPPRNHDAGWSLLRVDSEVLTFCIRLSKVTFVLGISLKQLRRESSAEIVDGGIKSLRHDSDWIQCHKLPNSRIEVVHLDDETKFTSECVKYDYYDVGTTLTLCLVDIDPELNRLVMINRNGKSWKRMNEVNLIQRLQEYGEAVNETYTPVLYELCIAKYEDVWYRGLVTKREPGQRISIYLIDNGRRIDAWHTDIRRMISEFLNYNAVALECRITDLNIDTKKYDLQLLKNKEISGCTIVQCLEKKLMPIYRLVIKNLYKYFE